MKLAFLSTTLIFLIASAAWQAVAQPIWDYSDLLDLPTSVLVLKDGEQLVIRGSHEVKGPLVFFFLDHGRYPTPATVAADKVDFEATSEANKQLRLERERHRMYLILLEQRQKRLLEVSTGRAVVVRLEGGAMTVEEQKEAIEQEAVALQQEFPVLEVEDATGRPETWWRDESSKLFTALNQSNNKIAELGRSYEDLVFRINRSTSESEVSNLRSRLAEVQKDLNYQRFRAEYIGARLGDLSAYADELGIPIAWLIPDNFEVIDESPSQQSSQVENQESGTGGQTAYKADDLYGMEDEWWANERALLEKTISEAGERRETLRKQYNDLLQQRQNAASDFRKRQLTKEIEKAEIQIRTESNTIDSTRKALDQLIAAARQLGKEEALGIMTEREVEVP